MSRVYYVANDIVSNVHILNTCVWILWNRGKQLKIITQPWFNQELLGSKYRYIDFEMVCDVPLNTSRPAKVLEGRHGRAHHREACSWQSSQVVKYCFTLIVSLSGDFKQPKNTTPAADERWMALI